MLPEEILARTLTPGRVICTPSSYTERLQQAEFNPNGRKPVNIGRGLQGVVSELAGMPGVAKMELRTNPGRSLSDERDIHRLVATAFELYGGPLDLVVQIPRYFDFIPRSSKLRADGLFMERILPLPKVVRNALITRFHPEPEPETVTKALDSVPNKHCLVRTYLGRKTRPQPLAANAFSMRTFPLYLEEMEALNMDIEGLARSMGSAFAAMHWGAGVDGDDVEFVLGTADFFSPPGKFPNRAITYWVLDFGQCRRVDLFTDDADTVNQVLKGAMVTGDNQLFIPHYTETNVFDAFHDGYIKAAGVILRERGLDQKFDGTFFFTEYVEYARELLQPYR